MNSLGRCGESMTKKLRLEAFRNLLRQDIGFFDDLKHGTVFLSLIPSFYFFCIYSSTSCNIFCCYYYGCPNSRIYIRMAIDSRACHYGSTDYWKCRSLIFYNNFLCSRFYFNNGIVCNIVVRTIQIKTRYFLFRENLCQAHTYGGVFSLIFFMYALAFWLGSIFVDNHVMQPTDVYRYIFILKRKFVLNQRPLYF
uniref:ABC transmembrane type-1 domain-containing protein n=1 Tax=Heterorhabditis bacteriophora TaxID=37862 RepID=A0A1I7WYK1_HETBA